MTVTVDYSYITFGNGKMPGYEFHNAGIGYIAFGFLPDGNLKMVR
jgi:hypothetical protein